MENPLALIIEDDEQFRELLESNLSLEGFEVYLAGDGPRVSSLPLPMCCLTPPVPNAP